MRELSEAQKFTAMERVVKTTLLPLTDAIVLLNAHDWYADRAIQTWFKARKFPKKEETMSHVIDMIASKLRQRSELMGKALGQVDAVVLAERVANYAEALLQYNKDHDHVLQPNESLPDGNDLRAAFARHVEEKRRAKEQVEPLYAKEDAVNHPAHYGGRDNPFEARKVIRAWDLNFNLGNVVKYLSRAGKKDPTKRVEDLKKALFYLRDELGEIDE